MDDATRPSTAAVRGELAPALASPSRLAALAAFGVMDTPAEPEFDDAARLAARVCRTPVAFVTFVDAARQFFKATVGVGGGEVARHAGLDVGFCPAVVAAGRPLVVPDAAADPAHAGNPAVTAADVRFYAGVPLTLADGQVLGTVCVVDRVPRELSAEQADDLAAVGRQVVAQLELRRELAARAAAEAALASAADRLRSVVASAVDYAVIGITAAGVIDGWSTGAVNTFGWPADQAVGRPFDLIWTADDRAAGSPGKELATAEADGVAPDNRWHQRADGRRVYVTGATRPVRDAAGTLAGFVKVCRDETTQRATAEALRAERELLRTVFDEAPDDAILVLDADRTLTGWNPAAERITGWAAAEAVGRTADIIFTPEDRAADEAAREASRAAAGGKTADERWHVRKDGRRFWGSGTMNALHHPDGSVRGFLKVFRDATDRHQERETLAFLGRLTDVLIAERDADRVIRRVLQMLCEHMDASRVVLAEGEPDGVHAVVRHDYAPGLPSFLGRHRVADFGSEVSADHLAGRAHRSADARSDDAAGDGPAGHSAVRAIVGLSVPVVMGDGLTALVAVHQTTPRSWTDAEVALVRQVAERMVGVFERARAEAAVRASEARGAAALAVADLGTFDWDLRADAVAVDARTRELFAFDPAAPLSSADFFARIVPADLDRARSETESGLRTGGSVVTDYDVRLPDGTVRPISCHGRVARGVDGRPARMYGVFADLTDRRRAERAVAESEGRLRALVMASNEVLYRMSPDWAEMWQLRGGSFIADTDGPNRGWLEEYIHPDDQPRVRAAIADAVAGKRTFDLEHRVLRVDGTVGWTASRAVPILDAAGDVGEWFGAATDVTGRKRAEADREHLLRAERAARAEAEQAGRMKDEFLATLSHELRTPLNAIVGWTQILRSAPGDAGDLAEGLAVIDRNARAQTQIIEDILDMSRIISGKLRLDVRRVDLAEVVRAGADTVRPAADAKGVRLSVVLDPGVGPVSGDPSRLHQVFWNLLSNAVKFTPKGGRVQVVLGRVDSHVEVSVTDTGEGIEADFLPHVFDRFRQADASTTRRHGGLGLGLAIVKQVADLHGGSVRVTSPGKGLGSTFVVALPLTILQPPATDPEPAREHPHAAVPVDARRSACDELAGVTVVVVDDEADARTLVARLLTDCGAAVRTAGSAAEALDLVRADPPAVLVSDIGMPGEDGYALIRQVRALPADRGGRVYAVALTAYARAADRVRVMEAGFQMHLSKPVEPAELVVTVSTLAKLAVGPAAA